MKRWFILLCAGLLVAATAFLNIWSIFQKPIMALFPGSTPSQIVLVYSLTLFMMAVVSPFGGRLMDKFGPRNILVLGCVLWAGGCYLNSMVTEVWQFYITYCLVMGIGDALIYTNCVVNTVRWFPDRKALASGIIVTFGALGPMAWTPMALRFLGDNANLANVFTSFGIFFAAFIVLALFVAPPPAGYRPAGWTPAGKTNDSAARDVRDIRDVGPRAMFRDPAFYAVVLTFMCGTGTGGMLVGHSAAIGINQIGMTAALAAQSVTIFALCNAAGRIILGYCSDHFGRYVTQGSIFVVYMLGAGVLYLASSPAMFFLGCGIIALGWGGTWASYPAITSEFWGTKNLGMNYGLVFIGASIGGFVYPKIAAHAVETTGTYTLAYLCAAAFALAGVLIIMWMSREARKRNAA